MCDHVIHKLSISDLLTRFFQAFDDKNWTMMRDCLCDEVVTDYSAFRGGAPATITRERFVEQRRTSLEPLDMQHNFLNLRVELDRAATAATARCNYMNHRFQMSLDGRNDHYFHSYGHYVFGVVNVHGTWKIASITQTLLRSQGKREIHGALRARDSAS